jgi:hypothetical protein
MYVFRYFCELRTEEIHSRSRNKSVAWTRFELNTSPIWSRWRNGTRLWLRWLKWKDCWDEMMNCIALASAEVPWPWMKYRDDMNGELWIMASRRVRQIFRKMLASVWEQWSNYRNLKIGQLLSYRDTNGGILEHKMHVLVLGSMLSIKGCLRYGAVGYC